MRRQKLYISAFDGRQKNTVQFLLVGKIGDLLCIIPFNVTPLMFIIYSNLVKLNTNLDKRSKTNQIWHIMVLLY